MTDTGANVAGSVTVSIGGTLTPLEAALAKAEQLTRAFDARLGAAMSGSGIGSAMANVNASVAKTSETLAAVTAPAAAASAKIAAVGSSAVAAAAGIEPLRLSAADVAAAMAGGSLTAANFNAAIAKLAPVSEEAAAATSALAEATVAATVTTDALGAATAKTSNITSGASVEFARMLHAAATGQFGRLASETATLGTRLGEAGTSALTFGNITKSLGSFAGVFFNPYVLGFFAIGAAIDLVVHNIGGLSGGFETATQALKLHETELSKIVDGFKAAKQAADDYTGSVEHLPVGASLLELQQQLKDANKQIIDFTGYAGKLGSALGGGRAEVDQLMGTYLSSFAKGKEDISDLVTQLTGLKNSDLGSPLDNLNMSFGPLHLGTKAFIADLVEAAQKESDAERQIKAITAAIQALTGELGGQTSLDKFFSGSFDALDAQKITQSYQTQLASITALSPAQKGQVAYQQKLNDLSDTGVSYTNMLTQAQQSQTLAYTQAAHAISMADQQRLMGVNDNIAAARVQLSTVGMSISETTRLTFIQQQMATAQQAAFQTGTRVTAAYTEQIKSAGAALGDLAQQQALAQLNDQMAFDRSQIGRSSGDQGIATTLKSYFGDSYTSQMNGSIAQTMRMTAALSDMKQTAEDLGSTFISTFSSSLQNNLSDYTNAVQDNVQKLTSIVKGSAGTLTAAQQATVKSLGLSGSQVQDITALAASAQLAGMQLTDQQTASINALATSMADAQYGASALQRAWTSAWSAMGAAASSVLDQLAQKLESKALDTLISGAFGGATSGGGGGGLLGGILSLFGAGGAAGGSSAAFSIGGAAMYAGGGMVNGPGTGTSDSIAARLSNGEFVVKAAAVPANLPALVAMNKGFAAGGLVGSANSNYPMQANGNAGAGSPIYISIDARGAQEGVAVQIAQAARDAVRYQVPTAIRQNNANPYRVGYTAVPATGK